PPAAQPDIRRSSLAVLVSLWQTQQEVGKLVVSVGPGAAIQGGSASVETKAGGVCFLVVHVLLVDIRAEADVVRSLDPRCVGGVLQNRIEIMEIGIGVAVTRKAETREV